MSEIDPGIQARALDQAYLITFTSAPGREVLEDLFWAYFERPMVQTSDLNPSQMLAFREGQRSVVLEIRAAIRRARNQGSDEEFISAEELEA